MRARVYQLPDLTHDICLYRYVGGYSSMFGGVSISGWLWPGSVNILLNLPEAFDFT